ncbi:MAG: pyrroloquinoline quinone precursor peptide PqqA [Cyanobacteria bacterium DS2.3.42]|nr:pyrroloquinoline quinone precursor peptide PqqA [Cyanobacteria bacterium DS2.3.42]
MIQNETLCKSMQALNSIGIKLERIMWEKPSYEIISAGAEITAYIHKR